LAQCTNQFAKIILEKINCAMQTSRYLYHSRRKNNAIFYFGKWL